MMKYENYLYANLFSDFILVFEEQLESKSGNSELVKIGKWRQKLMKNLHKIGLEIEEVLIKIRNYKFICFFF